MKLCVSRSDLQREATRQGHPFLRRATLLTANPDNSMGVPDPGLGPILRTLNSRRMHDCNAGRKGHSR
jgi:hypothetical protein